MVYIDRTVEPLFLKHLKLYKVVAVLGPRQTGKTTFLTHELKKTEKANYVSLDDPDAKFLFNDDIKLFEKQYCFNYAVTFIDEIQYGLDVGQKIKYLADKNYTLLLSSSSDVMANKEVLSYLVGRASILRLFQFSFYEVFDAYNIKVKTDIITKRIIFEQCIFGSYPKVVLTTDIEEKKILLKNLYETMLYKDIANNFGLGDISNLERFVKYLAISCSKLISYDNISRDLGLSYQTIKKYLNALEKSYFICNILPYYSNKLKEITKQPKIYFFDCGLRNTILSDYPPSLDEQGQLFENYVFSELKKQGYNVKYWRSKTKQEVDFIIEMGKIIIPIEVKLSCNNPHVEKSLNSFIGIYKPEVAYVVYYNGKSQIQKVKDCEVSFVNIDELLQKLQSFASKNTFSQRPFTYT